jgi:hypothetical protein
MLIYVKVNSWMLISMSILYGVKVLVVPYDYVNHILILTGLLLVIHGLLVCSVLLLSICMAYFLLGV